MKIVIDPEFQALIPPLSKAERAGFEQDMIRDGGCRDALVVWQQEGDALVLLDGHNRYEICQRHNLSYSTVILKLPSREHAMRWILENQLNRRNLSKAQRALLAARSAKLPAHRPSSESAQNCALTQSEAGEKQLVSRRTTQHAKRVLDHGSAKLQQAVTNSIIPVSIASAITKFPFEEQDQIAEQCIKHGDAQPARDAAAEVAEPAKRRKTVAVGTPPMDGLPRFAVVLADLRGREPGQVSDDPTTVNHQLMNPGDQIKTIRKELSKHLTPDALLFVPALGPQLTQALALVTALGFEYVAQIVMVKPETASDNFVLYGHDLLLIGARGEGLPPNQANRLASIRKEEAYAIIERMYGGVRKLALFAGTERRTGWTPWENGATKPTTPDEEVDLD